MLDHRAHLSKGDADTTTGANVTCLDGTFLATLATALATDDVPCKCQFGCLALVEVFQGDVNAVDEIFCFPGSPGLATSTTKESSTSAE